MARRDKVRQWSNLKGQLPEYVDLSPRAVEVNAAADARLVVEVRDSDGNVTGTRPVTMDDLAGEWAILDEEQGFEDLARDKRGVVYDALKRLVLRELEKVKAIAGTDMWRGQEQTFSPKFMLNIKVKDPIALRRWVEETKQDHLLAVPSGRLKAIVGEAMNTDLAAAMTPAERAALKPGMPGSGQPPPGVDVSLFETVHHTSTKRKPRPETSDPEDDGPF